MGKIDIKKLKKQLSLADYEKIIKALNIPIMIKTNTHWVDKVHTVHVVLGKSQAAVDDNHILAILQDGHIFTDFIQTAQRNNL